MKRVLVADDTKNIRLLLMKCLQMEGYEVLTANDGFAAREILLNEKIDLAFVDIKMPNLSGTEVIRSVRSRGVTAPIIVITAYATVRNAVECTQMGVVAYLQKPFTADKVKSVLQEYFDGPVKPAAYPDSSLQMARTLMDKGEFIQCIQNLTAILSKDAANPEIYLLLSKAYGGLGNLDLEKKFFQAYKAFSGSET